MRRMLVILAAVMAGATSAAPAQTRARIGARLAHESGAPVGASPNLVVHVSDLLADPRWLDALHNAYPIQLHWKAQLWQTGWFGRSRPPVEWEVTIQQVPVIDVFRYTERIAGRTRDTSFASFDALKSYVESEVQIPTPRTLGGGRWYYTVDLRVAALTQEQFDRRTESGGLSWWQQMVMGSGPSADLPEQKTAVFTVPER